MASDNPASKLGPVIVDGATGYLGQHLVYRLVQEGFPVRALVHKAANRKDMEFLSTLGAQVYVGDLDDMTTAALAFNNARYAVHLIGSIAPKRGERLEKLHKEQSNYFARLAKQAGVEAVILVTALGTSSDANNQYHLTKLMAEQEIIACGIPYTIMRPSLLVGRFVGNRDSKLVRRYRELILTRPVVPLINGGKNLIQPLFIGDMVEAACLSLAERERFPQVKNAVLELGGPAAITMRAFVETYMSVLKAKKPITTLQPGMANLLASLCEAIQSVPTISRDQVKLAQFDNICDDNAFETVFGINPVPLRPALESYNLNTLPDKGF